MAKEKPVKPTINQNGFMAIQKIQAQGSKAGKSAIARMRVRFCEENADILKEARIEQTVLRTKRFFKKMKWEWPPKKHICKDIADAINAYYGEEICEHIPRNKKQKS